MMYHRCGLYSLQVVLFNMVTILFPREGFSVSMATSLKGKHLIILPTQLRKYMETRVNSSGHVIETNGSVPEMLNWLSNRLQFDFSYLPSVTSLIVDDTPNQRGKLSYLKNYEADMVVGAIVMTSQRYEQADFPQPWLWISFAVIIPSPKTTTSFGSLFHPLQFEVWIGLALTTVIFIFCLGRLSKFSNILQKISGNQQQTHNSYVISLDSITNHVFSVLLSQGGYLFANNSLVICLATGAWSLACVILVQSYSSTLISFLTLPQFAKPIINSIYDIPKVKNLQVVTDRGLASDNLLSTADFGIFKQFGAMLNNNPNLRCNKSEQCIGRVKSGSHVYIGVGYGVPLLDLAIQADCKKDGVCNIVLLNERFLSSMIGFAIAKRNDYMEEFNRGIEELMGYGLAQYWDKKYVVPMKFLCHFENKRQSSPAKTRLTLNNLAGAFGLLCFGYLISFLCFLAEKIFFHIKGIGFLSLMH